MKTKLYLFAGLILGVSISLGSIANAQLLPQTVKQGGTGWGNLQADTLLTGNGTTRIATTTVGSGLSLSGGVLTATGSTGTGTVSTSSVPTVGQLAYWTSAAYPSLLGAVATTTLTGNNGLTLSAGNGFLVGGTNATIGLATINAGVLGSVTDGAVPTSQATSTLYGTGTGGQVLMWSGSQPIWAATSTSGGSQTPWASNIDGGNFNLTNVAIASSTTHIAGLGLDSAPAYTFAGDTDTGIYSPSAGSMTLATNGVNRFLITSTVNTSNSDLTSNTSGGWFLERTSNSATSPTYTNVSDVNTGMYFPNNTDTLGFSTAGVNRLTIGATGNVGIGSTTPWGKLSIAGLASEPTSPLFTVSSSTANSTTTVFQITSQGYVGLGTTTPGSLLSIQGNGLFSGALFVGGVITSTSTAALSITGLAGTATALATNGANCTAGNYPLGVDASGAVEDCTAAGAGSAFPFTPTTYSGVAVNATSTPLWLKATSPYSLIASSTFATYASSTQLTNSGNTWLTGMTSAMLLTGTDGLIAEYAGAGCTNQVVEDVSALGATTCVSIESEQLGDDDWGELTVASGVVTIDDDVIGAEHFADQDWGDISISSGVASVEDDSHAHTSTTISGLDISADTNLAATWPVILTGDTLSFGGLSTSSPLSAGLLYATGVNTLASVSTSSAIQMSITGNAATVTTNANLSGVVTSSGNTTSYGSQTAGVLGNSITGNTAVMATSTLYGAVQNGKILGGSGGNLIYLATTTFSGGLLYAAGNVTNTLTAGDGLTRNTDDFDLDIPVLVASGGTGVTSFTANSLLYSDAAGTAIAYAATSTLSIGGNAATVTTNANLSGAVTSSGSNVTAFGTLAQGILGNPSPTATIPTALATSTLYGNTATFGSLKVGIASTTPNFTLSVGTAGADFYVDSTGKIVGRDTTNSWSGRISPTRSFGLSTGTTTTWTASTTGSAYSPFMTMPFAGTLRAVRCTLDASFLGVNVQVNGSNATPSYFVASTTVGKVLYTAGNTFTVGQKILANFGTTTTATTKGASCTFDVTET